MREYITTGKLEDVIKIMSEDASGCREVIIQLIAVYPTIWEQLSFLLTMDDMNIRGVQILYLFHEYCKDDIQMFKNLIESRDGNIVTLLNNIYPNQRAVQGNAFRSGKRVFQPHPNIIYIIDVSWKVLLQIEGSGVISLVNQSGDSRRVHVQYLNDCYFLADGAVWHMAEFAAMLSAKRLKCNPDFPDSQSRHENFLYTPPRTAKEKKLYAKKLAGGK